MILNYFFGKNNENSHKFFDFKDKLEIILDPRC